MKIRKNIFKQIALSFVVIFTFALNAQANSAEDNKWETIVQEIEAKVTESVEAYENGDIKKAKTIVSSSYFDIFEASGMEKEVSLKITDEKKTHLETLFNSLRSAYASDKGIDVVMEKKQELLKELNISAKTLDEKNKKDKEGSAFALLFNSFLIILREGFEAILVISALSAYLVKTGNKDKVKTIYAGAGIALIASVIFAYVITVLFKISGAAREAIEGITMLVASAVLFYVSYWLISKIEVAKWQHYIKNKIDTSITKGSVAALAFAAFLAVFREGAETVLFYQALYSSSDGDSTTIFTGFAAGSLVLVVVFYLIRVASIKIPTASFFSVTSALLYYLAFSFAGRGILELQEAEMLSSTFISGLPTIHFFGIYPTLEGIALQSVLLFAIVGALFYIFYKKSHNDNSANHANEAGGA